MSGRFLDLVDSCCLICGFRYRAPKNSPPVARRHGLQLPFHCFQLGATLSFLFFVVFCLGILTFSFRNTGIRWLTTSWMLIIFVVYFCTFIAVCLIDPASIKVYKDLRPVFEATQDTPHVVTLGRNSGFCNVCQLDVPIHSKHCRTCNKCIGDFDHHCLYLNNCIGGRNYSVFILYLVLVITGAAAVFTFALILVVLGGKDSVKAIRYQAFGTETNRFAWMGLVITTLVCAGGLLVSVLILFNLHWKLMWRGRTTYSDSIRDEIKSIIQKRKEKAKNMETQNEQEQQRKEEAMTEPAC